jgi:hypothetical protein
MNAQDYVALPLALASAFYALRWIWRSISGGRGCGHRCDQKFCGRLNVVTRDAVGVASLPVIQPEEHVG